MSKLGCNCGAIIRDQESKIPYKGSIIRDQDEDHFLEALARDLAAFQKACSDGTRDEWLRTFFLPGYPDLKLDNENVIADILTHHLFRIEMDVFQCESCGSFKVETAPGSNRFVSFSANDWKPGTNSILRAHRDDA